MRAFFHFNEMHPEFYKSFPALILTSRKLTLWSPGLHRIQELHKSGRFAISPDDFVALVEQGVLRVAGRADWFDPVKRSTNERWKRVSPWLGKLDDRIADLRVKDSGKDAPRVFALAPERGESEAEAIVKDGEADDRYIIADALVSEGRIPVGIRERLENDFKGNITKEIEIREIIRHAINHADALNLTHSQISVEDHTFPVAEFKRIGGVTPAIVPVETVDVSRVLSLVELILQLKPLVKLDDILEFKSRSKLLDEIDAVLFSSMTIKGELMESMKAGISNEPTIFGELFGSHTIQHAVKVGSLLLAIGSATATLYAAGGESEVTQGLIAARAALGMAATTATLSAPAVARRLSLVRDYQYTGPTWPVFLTTSAKNPTIKQIRETIRKIERLK